MLNASFHFISLALSKLHNKWSFTYSISSNFSANVNLHFTPEMALPAAIFLQVTVAHSLAVSITGSR